MNKMSIFRKSALIALIGPLYFLFSRIAEIIRVVNILGVSGNYSCAISIERKCSLSEYIFKSDESVITYIGIVLSFISLLLITSYIFFLVNLYRKGAGKLFWILIIITILVIIASPFVINYIELIS